MNYQQTSLDAYNILRESKTLDQQTALVRAVLLNQGPSSNRMIAWELNKWWLEMGVLKVIEPSTVSARINELRKASVVEEAFRGYCHVTGKKVIFWRLV